MTDPTTLRNEERAAIVVADPPNERPVSHVCNSYFLTRPTDPTWLHIYGDNTARVHIEGWFVAPLELFTKRQLNAIRKRYREMYAPTDIAEGKG